MPDATGKGKVTTWHSESQARINLYERLKCIAPDSATDYMRSLVVSHGVPSSVFVEDCALVLARTVL